MVRHLLCICLAACHHGGAREISHVMPVADPQPPSSSLMVATICTEAGDVASAKWPAARERGRLFVLADASGYVATARIGEHERDCDDCEGPSIDAEIIDRHGVRPPTCFVAVGPVAGPLARARIIDGTAASRPTSTEWTVSKEIDLDGDARADLAVVTRCAHVLPSGCGDSVCDRTCDGVRIGLVAEVTSVMCRSFVPDIDDCEP
jgi:hypothetical protein